MLKFIWFYYEVGCRNAGLIPTMQSGFSTSDQKALSTSFPLIVPWLQCWMHFPPLPREDMGMKGLNDIICSHTARTRQSPGPLMTRPLTASLTLRQMTSVFPDDTWRAETVTASRVEAGARRSLSGSLPLLLDLGFRGGAGCRPWSPCSSCPEGQDGERHTGRGQQSQSRARRLPPCLEEGQSAAWLAQSSCGT